MNASNHVVVSVDEGQAVGFVPAMNPTASQVAQEATNGNVSTPGRVELRAPRWSKGMLCPPRHGQAGKGRAGLH
jgi:hypothetical protein